VRGKPRLSGSGSGYKRTYRSILIGSQDIALHVYCLVSNVRVVEIFLTVITIIMFDLFAVFSIYLIESHSEIAAKRY